MKFTLSVKSFHVPDTPSRLPDRRAFLLYRPREPHGSLQMRRVELVDHRIDCVLSSRISPFTSTVIFFDKSPFATAVVTSAMFRT